MPENDLTDEETDGELRLGVVIAGTTEHGLEGNHLLELAGAGLAGWLGWEVGPGLRNRTSSRDETLRIVD